MRSLASAGVSWVLLGIADRGLGTLVRRGLGTTATCPPTATEDWLWMDNADDQTPCLQAAYFMSPCVAGNYNVQPINSSIQYDPLKADPETAPCTCTWVVYNLFSACTACQGFQDSIPGWVRWSGECTGVATISTTLPYPANVTVPQNVTFPNWAAVNPTTWPNQRFDTTAAQTFASQHPGDWVNPGNATTTPTLTPNHSGTNVGAIAGGVVGGVVVLAIGIAAAVFLYCRQKRRKRPEEPPLSMVPTEYHIRSPSDLSAKTFATSFGYSPLGNTSPSNGSSRLLSSPTTIRTHDSISPSFAHESMMQTFSLAGTPPPPQGAAAALPNAFMASNGVVQPFTLERPSSSQDTPMSLHDRKRSEASAHIGDASGPLSSTARGLMNPPAYSVTPHGHGDFSSQAPDQASTYGTGSIITTPSQSNPSRRPQEKTQSMTTMTSYRSSSSTTSAGYYAHGPTASLSGAISQMAGPTNAAPAYARPDMTVKRDEKQRPTDNQATDGDTENTNHQAADGDAENTNHQAADGDAENTNHQES